MTIILPNEVPTDIHVFGEPRGSTLFICIEFVKTKLTQKFKAIGQTQPHLFFTYA